MMKVLVVGDSFTYGEELDDVTKAWPYLVSDTVTNKAIPGRGNTQMIRTVVETYSNYDLIIIAWSHYARVEFADETGIYDTWPGNRGRLFGSGNHRLILTDYIAKHHNDKYQYNQHLINVILLQNFLKQQNKRYLMLDAFGNTDCRHLGNTELVDQIDPTYYVGWPDTSMMEWAFTSPQGSGGHFLEEGHIKVAEKINEHIRNLGWIS